MTDYGHELLFGVFLTPSAAEPERVVALAQLADRLGLDLATFQDHPYQPAHLDAWTLMSYVAARTERIRISANVLNLPLRQPVVIARSAASLDLLSGGRVELGLGAGAFWDAIEAAGGRRLTSGRSVDALAEAIEVIRAIWDADERSGVRVAGEHYRVVGARRGPAPAHDIGIWLGAYKPRMLRLTGQSADGWIPSLGYLPGGPADLTGMNSLIDDGAGSAGRSPSAVRRFLNVSGAFQPRSSGLLAGPVEQWVEELAELTLSYGISGFILASDDPEQIQRFAAEVAPALAELVADERLRAAGNPESAAEPEAQPDPASAADGLPSSSSSRSGVSATGAESPSSQVSRSGSSTPGSEGGVSSSSNVSLSVSSSSDGLRVRPTADDGTRLAERTVWDESTRPLAPPVPAGTVYSATSQAVGQHLIDVHDHLRQELDQVRDILRQVKQGTLSPGRARSAINEMTMRQNDWTLGAYCATYCRTVTQHHSLEDAQVFPHLRRADAGLAPVIDRLEEEHVVIHEVLEDVDRALVGFVATPDDFSGLQAAMDLLTDVLLSHLAYEEQQIVEPLARLGFYPGQV